MSAVEAARKGSGAGPSEASTGRSAPRGRRLLRVPYPPECHNPACPWWRHFGDDCERHIRDWQFRLGEAEEKLLEALEEWANWLPDEDDRRTVADAAAELLGGDDLGIAGEAS